MDGTLQYILIILLLPVHLQTCNDFIIISVLLQASFLLSYCLQWCYSHNSSVPFFDATSWQAPFVCLDYGVDGT